MDSLSKSLSKLSWWVFRLVAGTVVYGFVVKTLWMWFVLPIAQFYAEPLTMAQACGLMFFLGVLRFRAPSVSSVMEDKLFEAGNADNYRRTKLTIELTALTLVPAMMLGIGWVLHRALHS
jgi:hypothetical protein